MDNDINSDRLICSFSGKYFFLSNFYPVEMDYHGIPYSSSEAAFQAQKTTDLELRKIFSKLSAAESKRLGREIHMRPDWEQIKVEVMADIVHKKFEIPEMRKYLLSTGDTPLREGNWWGDKIWGTTTIGQGTNYLGKILMEERRQIREGEIYHYVPIH